MVAQVAVNQQGPKSCKEVIQAARPRLTNSSTNSLLLRIRI